MRATGEVHVSKGMEIILIFVVLAIAGCVQGPVLLIAAGPQQRPRDTDGGSVATTKSVRADDEWSLGLYGERRPLYRLHKSDVVAINFTFQPEFDQTVTVQPDGFIPLKGLNELYAEGATLPALQDTIRTVYANVLQDPEITVVLKEFDKPYFIAAGELTHPGKYELRADTTVTEAVAIAGGFNGQAKHSQVVLFRRVSEGVTESRLLNVKAMLKSRSLTEDMHLRTGDMVFVPQNAISKIRRFLPTSNLSLYASPTQF
jgi:polysaccharide export outer membrane protein